MTPAEQIAIEVQQLAVEQQRAVLDFVAEMRQKQGSATSPSKGLIDHPAFGSWRGNGVDSLEFQEARRLEWGDWS